MAADADRRGDDMPPSVRFILRLRGLVERRWPSLVLAAAVLASALAAAAGVYTVGNGEAAALLRFGKLVDDAIKPGLQSSWPGMHEVVKARIGDVFRLEIQGDFAPRLSLVTGDENLIEASLVVQYRIQNVRAYLFASESPEELLRQVVRAALVGAFVATPVDEVLTSGKAAIQNAVRQGAQQRLDRYGAGVTVVAVSLQAVDPPPEAAGSFRAVSDSRAEAEQSIQRAGGERDRALRLARGESEKLMTEARATADRRLQEARGAAARFESLLRQKRLSPDQTRTELYLAAVQKVLPAARLILLAPGEPPKIGVNLLERSGERPGIPPGVSFDDR